MKNETKKTYSEEVKTLSFVLNNRLNNKNLNAFNKSLRGLKQNYKTDLSTKFLRGLVENPSTKFKADKVSKVLKRSELKTQTIFNYITEYNNKGKIKSRESLRFVLI